ncbi:MAG: hypothetical protein LBR64_07875 [Dysgonamonadaceae bacterium]|jgi:hypothetical protein|nr:hypothetical protein [Dysgonamonadaceae bacterium]
MKSFGTLLLALAGFAIIASCSDDFENYTNNPQNRLSFSTDTLSFETALATVASPIRGFVVGNYNKQHLLVASIRLAGGQNSPFRINVDGMAGSSFADVPIRANDSIFVFADVKPELSGSSEPKIIRDSVIFEYNGIRQQVILEAFGQDVIVIRGDVLNDEYSLLDGKTPYLVYDSLVIAEGCTAEIAEGSTFYMYNEAKITVRGKILIRGSLEKPVTFRGSRTDSLNVEIPISYEQIPGQWGGIVLTSTSFGNEMENARIRNGKFGLLIEPSNPDRSKIILRNTVLTNVSGDLLTSVNSKISAENCEFSTSRGALLNLVGGDCDFLHCTLANFYPYLPEGGWLHSEREILKISTQWQPGDAESEPVEFPLVKANFANSVFASENTSSGIFIEEPETGVLPFAFRNCVFVNKGENDEQFTDCLFGANPDSLFVKNYTKKIKDDPNDRAYDYVFKFSLTENSPARDTANPALSEQLPLDMLGRNRFADGKPDAGAYEFAITE